MKKILFTLLFLAISTNIFSQYLSNDAKIFIISCSPGAELYQAFGHTAIWVTDKNNDISYIFHYGAFDYSDPDFYLNFIKGKLNYMLSVEDYDSFISEYTRDQRDVWKLELNIDYTKKQNLFRFLLWKSLPENKYYMYDFFMDNCATRVRDLMKDTYKNSISYPDLQIDKSYRDLIEYYMQSSPWTRFGINLILGLPADKKLNTNSAMFLPDYIDTVFMKTKIITVDDSKNMITERSYMVHSDYSFGKKTFFSPSLIIWSLLLMIIIATFIEIKKKKNFKIIDFLLLFTVGIAGIIILFMWVGTEHVPTKWNLNIIWAVPTHLLVAFLIFFKKNNKFIRKYLLSFAVINTVLLFAIWFLPQKFDIAVLPIILIMCLRFWTYLKK